jgi:thioredoxin 1
MRNHPLHLYIFTLTLLRGRSANGNQPMNRSEFQQKISTNELPLVIDFWAPWCTPCRVTKPILEKLAGEYRGKVEFLPINADDSQELVQSLKIFGIPTVLTMRSGKEVGRVVGAQNETNFRAMFDALASGKEVKVPLTQFDRLLRLGAGGLFVMIGISTGNWIVGGIGVIIAFMGIYDHCPLWQALTGFFKKEEKTL